MKWVYDYENNRMVHADNDGYDYDNNRLMRGGMYDEDCFEDDICSSKHDHEFNQNLLESDMEQAMASGWIQNENYNNTYGVYNEQPSYNSDNEEQSWLNEHTNYDEDNDGVIDNWFDI